MVNTNAYDINDSILFVNTFWLDSGASIIVFKKSKSFIPLHVSYWIYLTMKIEPFRCPNACRMEVSVTLRHYTQTCHQQRRRGNLESIPIKRDRERERERESG